MRIDVTMTRHRWRQLSLIFLASCLLVCLATAWWLLGDLPAPAPEALRAIRPSTLIYDQKGRLLYEAIGDQGKQTPLSFEQIPPACWQATVAVEDSRFFQHPGVDLLAIGRAAWQNWRQGAVVSGASTLTQQLARNTLLSQDERFEQSLRRKLREAWLALQIELRYSKQEILALYLNQVYYGNFAYGLEAAAQAYFGRQARELDLAQCSLLAGLLQNPAIYNPLQNLESARWRQATVLNLMVWNGYITRQDAELALAERLQFAATPFPIEAPHFVGYVEGQLERLLGADVVKQGGLRVATTLDLDWNREAERIIQRRLQQLKDEPNAPAGRRIDNAAVVILNPQSGAILAMIGSPDYFDASIAGAMNAAVALRQPGSAIKPLTYAAAMDPQRAAAAGHRPLTPATVIADVRTTFLTAEDEPYVPQNYDMQWHGPVSARTALASSYNLPAVKVLEMIGVDELIAQAQRQGITTFRPGERYGLALTLGGGEVSLLELAAAYGVFANGGWRVQPYAIERVEDVDGKALFELAGGARAAHRVLDERVAFLISDILSDDDARAPSFGRGSVLKLSRPAAVKTGTTTDWRDNWTVGYTSDLAAGVWVGNADNTPMVGVSGVTGAGPIWHDVMEMAHKNLPIDRFAQPPGLVRAEVCVDSGLLPTEWCTRRRSELFIAGSEPAEFDAVYRPVVVDACAGGLAGADVAPSCRAERVFRVYPTELQEWARANGIEQPPAGRNLLAGSSVQDSTASVQDAQLVAGSQPPAALTLTSPDPNAVYRLVEALPQDQQRVRLAAQPGHAARLKEVTFLVDGRPLGAISHPPYEAWWTLQRGAHQVAAVGLDAAGRPVLAESIWIEVQ